MASHTDRDMEPYFFIRELEAEQAKHGDIGGDDLYVWRTSWVTGPFGTEPVIEGGRQRYGGRNWEQSVFSRDLPLTPEGDLPDFASIAVVEHGVNEYLNQFGRFPFDARDIDTDAVGDSGSQAYQQLKEEMGVAFEEVQQGVYRGLYEDAAVVELVYQPQGRPVPQISLRVLGDALAVDSVVQESGIHQMYIRAAKPRISQSLLMNEEQKGLAYDFELRNAPIDKLSQQRNVIL